MPLALIVHAGAWEIPDDEVEAYLKGCRQALATGWKILQDGGSALDAVQAAIIVMEDEPALDAAGQPGFAHNTSRMAYGFINTGMSAGIFGVQKKT
jgi:isoaspartyl peptidase/L-asparaginase-like protein (Ntn-hydrolase superfamily)